MLTLEEMNVTHEFYSKLIDNLSYRSGVGRGALESILSTAEKECHTDHDWELVCWIANMALEKIEKIRGERKNENTQ